MVCMYIHLSPFRGFLRVACVRSKMANVEVLGQGTSFADAAKEGRPGSRADGKIDGRTKGGTPAESQFRGMARLGEYWGEDDAHVVVC